MRRLVGWGGIVCGVWLVTGVGEPVAAETSPTHGYIDGSLRKFARGVVNVVTCPVELPQRMKEVEDADGFLASASVGVLQGTWRVLVRGVAGAYETVTFFVAIPKDFAPIVEPEFVFRQSDWIEADVQRRMAWPASTQPTTPLPVPLGENLAGTEQADGSTPTEEAMQ